MTNWVELDESKLDTTLVSRDGDGRPPYNLFCNVSMSPYDIPDAVRGFYVPSKKRFRIEFRYIAPEKTRFFDRDEHVRLEIGVHSERVYAIEVDVLELGVDAVAVMVTPKDAQAIRTSAVDAVTGVTMHPYKNGRESNYRVVKSVLEQEESPLFATN